VIVNWLVPSPVMVMPVQACMVSVPCATVRIRVCTSGSGSMSVRGRRSNLLVAWSSVALREPMSPARDDGSSTGVMSAWMVLVTMLSSPSSTLTIMVV